VSTLAGDVVCFACQIPIGRTQFFDSKHGFGSVAPFNYPRLGKYRGVGKQLENDIVRRVETFPLDVQSYANGMPMQRMDTHAKRETAVTLHRGITILIS
jgi:hypothetical protein